MYLGGQTSLDPIRIQLYPWVISSLNNSRMIIYSPDTVFKIITDSFFTDERVGKTYYQVLSLIN